MINLVSLTNPRYVNESNTLICADLEWDVVGEVLPTNLDKNDKEPHVQDAIKRIESGEFGSIAPFSDIPEEVIVNNIAANVRLKRNQKLAELDVILSNPLRWEAMSEEKKEEFRLYRQALLDIPTQDGFPKVVFFPQVPSV
jgi:hypothetical protein